MISGSVADSLAVTCQPSRSRNSSTRRRPKLCCSPGVGVLQAGHAEGHLDEVEPVVGPQGAHVAGGRSHQAEHQRFRRHAVGEELFEEKGGVAAVAAEKVICKGFHEFAARRVIPTVFPGHRSWRRHLRRTRPQ
jgi:hypothetical protein